MTARLGLHLYVVGVGAFNDVGHILGRLWTYNRRGGDADVEVVRLDPRYLVQSVAGKGDAAGPAVAHIAETGLESAWGVAHGGN